LRQLSNLDAEALIARYEARKPRFTEGDFMRRFAEIANARPVGIAGAWSGARPSDRVIALLASGRVSDAEYFRLADLLGFDSSGLIHADPAAERSFVELLRAAWKETARLVAKLRRQ